MDDKDRYAIGQQDFKTLRKDDAFYVDKTAFVEKIARSKENSVRLKIPNEEVRKDLFKDLLSVYLKPKKGTVKTIMDGIVKGISSGDPEMMMKNLDAKAEVHTSNGRVDMLIETPK